MNDDSTQAQDRSDLELEVKDFGPIIEARIALRPLTVFVGPSNTGKSCLATLIYALHRRFSADAETDYWRPFQGTGVPRLGRHRQRPGEIIEAFAKSMLGRSMLRAFLGKEEPQAMEGIPLPSPLLKEIRRVFNAQGRRLGDEIGRCFGVGTGKALIRRGCGDGARVVLRRRFREDAKPIEHALALTAQRTRFLGSVPEDLSLPSSKLDEVIDEYFRQVGKDILETLLGDDEDPNLFLWNVIKTLENFVRERVVGSLRLPAFFLPADRTGVMRAHGTMVGNLIGNAPTIGPRRAVHVPVLSGVLADFLEQIVEVDRTTLGRGDSLRDIGAQIEEAILGGTVSVKRLARTGYPNFMYRPMEWEEELHMANASSMVSELAPVVLYLRHLLAPGHLLIIEEPESSLHPAMQVELIRQLAAVVRAGVRVIVTTHSEWVLEELANIVRRSALSDDRGKEVACSEVALSPDKVGAWLFKSKHRAKGSVEGSVVEEVRIDEEIGLYPTDYDAVSEALYNENVRIFNSIQDAKSG